MMSNVPSAAAVRPMIGVVATHTDLPVVEEFFELFKTPWEPVVPGRKYRVVLSTTGYPEKVDSDVLLMYGSAAEEVDQHAGTIVNGGRGPSIAQWSSTDLPIYGDVATFSAGPDASLSVAGKSVDYRRACGSRIVWRIGYDLFAEVRFLLSKGQPVENAATPTLELHIALLRDLLVKSSVSFLEVPPRPLGYDFTCCLTHDIDFHGIRNQGFDKTLLGFIARALAWTFLDFLRGRRPFHEVITNWKALASLPFVFMGLAPDFWRPFSDYPRVERERRSTFFVVPFKGRPGVEPTGGVDWRRAVPYRASEIGDQLRGAVAAGREVAVHGIDAWRDADAGRAECAELSAITGQQEFGVRMHWLFFDDDSPQQLERAGFTYDSTWGYNDTIGYRAGTSQAFRLLGTRDLMELPLTIMDSALLYPGRMNLSRARALELCHAVVSDTARFGGTLVINWHDRSLAPERLWGAPYDDLLKDVEAARQVWFVTASEAVAWYRWRRSIRFSVEHAGRVTISSPQSDTMMPGARLFVYHPPQSGRVQTATTQEHGLASATDVTIDL
jgi:hypothetical protein